MNLVDPDTKETIEVQAEQIECVKDFRLNDTHQEIQEHADLVYQAAENATQKGIAVYDQPQLLGLKGKLTNFLNSYDACVVKYGVKAVHLFIENDIVANY